MKFATAASILALAAAVSADTAAHTVGQDLCCAANANRAQKGLPALKWLPALDQIAAAHNNYQVKAGVLDHFENTGSSTYSLANRLTTVNFEFSTAGENIANGFNSVASVETAWMNSEGHRDNILSTSFTVCGGAVSATGGYYTVDFASPMDAADNNSYYTLQCKNGLSVGATNGQAAAKPPAASPSAVPSPVVHGALSPAPAAPSSAAAVASSVHHSPVAHAAAETTAAQPNSGSSGSSSGSSGSNSGSSGSNKPIRMPKGSIAAGKCKACTRCSNGSPFRR
ncbi:hypothetical protein GGI25_005942 [Coemansia spiralis]|uniref:SCP domain-containing protein n=2 Tax=Coemansia TaxID=4863 RepID=A0A9W8G1C6_9FUNG|nr:hypothetical protein BX070DRAFT_250286 [Coemansia spiralis]KAJ1988946.1 hypothetical protein EDC05_004988 [Coemansia umbellata]KAJ2619930.1 hypothetical protein GGI26_005426 [Coemansia sp. RSA 1358]KAJ2670131.1 hypothetical protein GGI25_005942 [Coemansia spiralis]